MVFVAGTRRKLLLLKPTAFEKFALVITASVGSAAPVRVVSPRFAFSRFALRNLALVAFEFANHASHKSLFGKIPPAKVVCGSEAHPGL